MIANAPARDGVKWRFSFGGDERATSFRRTARGACLRRDPGVERGLGIERPASNVCDFGAAADRCHFRQRVGAARNFKYVAHVSGGGGAAVKFRLGQRWLRSFLSSKRVDCLARRFSSRPRKKERVRLIFLPGLCWGIVVILSFNQATLSSKSPYTVEPSPIRSTIHDSFSPNTTQQQQWFTEASDGFCKRLFILSFPTIHAF
jgi:hypothetical protein